ncbi:serine hydrolase domain-containing protein [Edaphobacillus lindanitolerans]|uniref:CubicO group peptidase, beta-lactamase class C family n=1 Tax=Edaphobacillus lindanitolerans TaxID=550447 RepID=A0A1U7PJ56_9BACI|nr:serine hydrolase domain-containing protein [Edaphobacillus lindanitolerans]SIT80420.1 CubicO group peptidase, beta-lactamase class C family [Edaphobacillus lindanitolerans]
MDQHKIRTFAEAQRKTERSPGLAVAFMENGDLYEAGTGTVQADGSLEVTPDTIFGTASVTKSFTALAVMILQAEGKLSVRDPVVSHLPELEAVKGIRRSEIRHLLSHTASLPPLERKEEIASFPEHFEYLKSADFLPLGEPGERLSYSNDAFLLLGAVIGWVSGMDYRTFIRERILEPAGMTRTTFDPPGQGEAGNVAVQYVEENGRLKAVDWPVLGNYAVGGGIRSTVRDLMKYLRLYVDEAYREEVLGIRLDVSEMWRNVHPVNRSTGYGYGLSASPGFHGTLFIHHGGSQPGVSSAVGFLPEKNMAAVVLSNKSDLAADRILRGMLNIGLGFKSGEDPFPEPQYEMDPEDFSAFEGIYRNDEDPDGFEIRCHDDGPVLVTPASMDALRASGPRTLVNIRTGKPVQFTFDERGAESAFSGMRIYFRDGQRN